MARGICILCRKSINNGIMINGKYICKSCEEKLISCNIDTDFYEYYKQCIKRSLAKYVVRNNYFNIEQYRN
ncbi:sigma factor G inhibitor Gin [Clostridium algidicarnis]|uniref:sigma factor G inhibitor Gin n=1 Tax=Clostridium algidicarnis TaxID=37659 RepID=UPI001C0B0058|nr:sigma factor G inhibitor Gin [Clostridium algidicarnis]MBU3196892.1 sigma factor G inhibitor Gin [Clostridium algidicarnis]MBU3210206.1 sigma factor G inhibitor Gin [Clostridium algidicarnis]MBU3227961.1 sigma factor G inhibitor Gin [Clostridium algidicarnis]MBU3251711.1 sigma factor G inhibitor Gin [Clostridium algidicarnis]